MADNKEIIPPPYDVNTKWDACLDLTVRCFVYSSLGGAFAGLLLFRSPVSRWASIAFGARLGIGSTYTKSCNSEFELNMESHQLPFPKLLLACLICSSTFLFFATFGHSATTAKLHTQEVKVAGGPYRPSKLWDPVPPRQQSTAGSSPRRSQAGRGAKRRRLSLQT
ncbi:hypothetical protein ACFX2H_013313 [Malus domestica]